MSRWGVGYLVVACMAATAVGCDEDATDETASAGSTAESASGQEHAEGAPETVDVDGPSGNVEGEPFVARGVLAQRLRDPEIEIRLFDRAVSCERFDEDYSLSEDEKVVIVMMQWPKSAGDTLALRASEVHERLQFCHGRESGRASCTPRAPEQGSLTVVAASPEGGTLSFDVSSDHGSLSGDIEFTLCER